ncbi:ribosome-binding factor A [Melioribacter roseus P3M-2]|jgi:ribosome-binding factor A|uniref:Ribosome-binding factor A n=1 Tax=Melioribacter roseus (strain DSM 23840 / JCM 17771 / VKM B-2668 / P3M-2) TaxID=1191523 RepID=I7A180_MELRP|nr:30S ribosome-binding factor RbfA [Melioribacter roseus]AFN74953.1 ribosome-binding factor A [Melioribacter roseus P3M-2]
MSSFRIDKVASMIKEELSLIFLHKIQDPSLSLITITSVKLSPDLKLSKVYLSVYEKEKREEVLTKVNELKGWIRTQLAGRIRVRFVPELEFFIDDTLDYVEKIETIFKKIHESDNKEND